MTAIIAELYFALGRNTKVILTRQDTHAHTQTELGVQTKAEITVAVA